jgi:hypothetical protein
VKFTNGYRSKSSRQKKGTKERERFMLGRKKHTIYSGNSFELFSNIKILLNDNNIDYKYKIHSHDKSFNSPMRGTNRSVIGSFRDDTIYEILVAETDVDNATYLLWEI